MPRRTIITASLLLLILALIALLPLLPPVRGLVVDRVAAALSDSGIDLQYDSSSGNAWRGVALEGVSITGAGSAVEIDRLRVGYFLPSLLGGELPLDIAVSGADGSLDLAEVLDEVAPAPAGPQARSISVRLRRLDLRDIAVDVEQLPFSLPDLGLEQLEVTQDGSNLLLDGVITTNDGEAEVSASYEALTGNISVAVIRADARIARHWWEGISSGQVTGELTIRGRNIDGDFVIVGAGVDYRGLLATEVNGTASLRYPVITADLEGSAFGGPVQATGVVNVEARRWEANGVAQPTLAAAANWLARSQFPDGLPVAIAGDAEVNLSLAGWNQITLNGTAGGSGSVQGVPLEGLNATFRMPSDGGLRADADSTLGGGPISFTMAPGDSGERLSIVAEGVQLEQIQAGLGQLDATANLALGPGGSGSLRAAWRGEPTGTPMRAQLDATLDPDGWQGFISAADDAGLQAEGAFVLADGRLEGRLTSDDLGRDLFTPGTRLALAVDGAVSGGAAPPAGPDSPAAAPAGLTLTLSIDGSSAPPTADAAGPATLALLPPDLAESLDLSGSVTGTLDLTGPDGPALRGLTGALGPLEVSGDVALSPLQAQFGLNSAPIELETVNTTVSIPASTLRLGSGGVSWSGTVEHSGAAAGPLRLEAGVLDALFTAPAGATWQAAANSRSGDLVLTAGADGIELDLNGLPVLFGDDLLAASASGSLRAELSSFAGSGAESAAVGAPDGEPAVDLAGARTPIAVDLLITPLQTADTQVGSMQMQLPGSLRLTGDVDLDNTRAELVGSFTPAGTASEPATTDADQAAASLAPLPLAASLNWGGAGEAAGFDATVTLAPDSSAEPLRATYQAAGGRFSLTGSADLDDLTTAARGELTADLAGAVSATGLTDLAGGLTATLSEPLPLSAELMGAGTLLEVNVSGAAENTPLSASGSIDISSFSALTNTDQPLLVATLGPFEGLGVGLRGASGSGTLDAVSLGPLSVPPTPWRLDANWAGEAPPRLTLILADEPLQITLTDGALTVDGQVVVPVTYSGAVYELQAGVPGGPVNLSDLSATPLIGTLTHVGGPLGEADGPDSQVAEAAAAVEPAGEVLRVEGTLAELDVSGSLATAQLLPFLPAGSRPDGRLSINGILAPLDGPTYEASVELSAQLPDDARAVLPGESGVGLEPLTLAGTITGSGANVQANLSGAGLSLELQNGALSLQADETPLAPFLGLDGSLDGFLTLDEDSNWTGSLSLSATLDLPDAAEPIVTTVELIGAGPRLEVAAGGAGPFATHLTAAGTISPEISLEGTLDAADGLLSGSLTYGARQGLVAELASSELLVEDYLRLPALAATLTLAPGEPLRLVAGGDTLEADLQADLSGGQSGDTLSGELAVPFTMLSEPAQLRASLSGDLTNPRAEVRIAGVGLLVEAVADLQTASADLTLDPAVAATLAPAAATVTQFVNDPVRAEANWARDSGWTLQALASANLDDAAPETADLETAEPVAPAVAETAEPLSAGVERVDLVLDLAGEADSYQGTLSAYLNSSPEPLTTADITGVGGDLAAELDLATVAWQHLGAAFGVDVDLSGSGSVTLASRPFRAGMRADLSGRIEGFEVSLAGSAPDDLDLSVASDDVDLSARLAWNDERKVVLQGTVSGRPVDGWLELSDDLRTGLLHLDAPGARVEAELDTVADVREIDLTASLGSDFMTAGNVALEPPSPDAQGSRPDNELRADITAHLTLDGSAATLDDLEATITGLPGQESLALTAAGRLTPTTDVTGELLAPGLGEQAALYVSNPSEGAPLTAGLRWQDLNLSYGLGEGRFRLTGSAALSEQLARYLPDQLAGARITVTEADLLWSPQGGFEGGLQANVAAPLLAEYGIPSPLTLQAAAGPADQAPNPLVISLSTHATPPNLAGASANADATVTIGPAITRPTELTVSGGLDLTALLPAQDQELSANAELTGTITAPVIIGTVKATGGVNAEGSLAYADGRGSLSIQGPHLNVVAETNGGNWAADARVDELPIERWLPQLAEPRLSFNASVSGGTGSPTAADIAGGEPGSSPSGSAQTSRGPTIDGLLLESNNTRLSGAATVATGVRVALQAQVDLADLQLEGASLTGLLRGPLVVTAPSLAALADANITAQLDAAEVGLAAVDATVSGVLQVGGRVSDPTVGGLLTGNGELSGSLRVNAAPRRGNFELNSTLAGPGFSTDLQVSVTPEVTAAGGRARYQDAVLLLSDGPDGIELSGAGRIDGWQATVATDLQNISASGPLRAVAPGLEGELDLLIAGASRPQDRPWLEARVTDLAAGGTAFGDLSVSSARPGADVAVSGTGIAATLSPADLTWNLEVSDVAVPGGLLVALEGSGTGANATLTGNLRSEAQHSPLGLDLGFEIVNATAAEPPTSISLAGAALGGELRADGSRAASGTWSGAVRLMGAELGGIDLAATGVLQGQGLIPQAVLATAALGEGADAGERPISIAGRISAGGNGVSFDQTASLPPLTSPVRLQGQLFPSFDVTLSAAGVGAGRAAGDATGSGAGAPSGATRLFTSGSGLRASGEFRVPFGPVEVIVDGSGPDAGPRLEVRLAAAPSVAATADFAAPDLTTLVAELGSEGLAFQGVDAAHGALRVSLAPTLNVHLDEFGAELAGFSLALSGALSANDAQLQGALRLPLELPGGAQAAGRELPLSISAGGGSWSLDSSGDLGDLAALYEQASGRLTVDVDLALPANERPPAAGLDQGLRSGAVVGRLTYDPLNGPAGTLALADVSLAPTGIGELTLNADTAIADGRLGGSATLDTAGGRVTLNGNTRIADFLPALASSEPDAAGGTNLEVRVRTLQLEEFAVVANIAPHLSGALSGVVQLRNGFLLGQFLAPELAIGSQPVPASLQLSGPPSDLDAAMQIAGSLFTADLGRGRIAGSSRLERFPIDLLGEAFVGPTDVEAVLTGVLRFDLPSTDPLAGYVRLATEEITLERAGVTTRGQVALSYEDRHLTVQQAEFGGEGSWTAQGVLGPDLLDFTLEANEADFSPLLGLVPALSRFAVGAAGSFTFSAQGDFSAPQVSLESDALDVTLAGNRFRIEATDVTLVGPDLSVSTTLRGLEPVGGAIAFSGGATVMLEPLALRSVDFGFDGALEVPGLGLVDDIRGTIQQNAENLPSLFMTGLLGAPLTVQGTLLPLDLRATGSDLELSLPTLLIADSSVSADLTLRSEEGGLAVGGALEASEVVIDPAARQAATQAAAEAPGSETTAAAPGPGPNPTPPAPDSAAPAAPAPAEPAASSPSPEPGEESLSELPPIRSASEQLELVDVSALTSTPTVAEAEAQGALNARAAVRFDDIRITAPQRVLLSMSIASLEASVDLTLAGTAAQPRLSGEARALRGSLRFSGREFTVNHAVAAFSPSRGVLPELDVSASAEFEKTRVLAGATDVEFVAPSEGNTFSVDLAFTGPVLLDEESGGIRFDIRPVLTSPALVEISGEGVGAGVRPLTEAELLSLITLGRIEFGSDLIGAGGLGGAVAQGALDTAVDLLVVGELQNALREALGLDVVEIRTTAFSSLLGGEGAQPFGVSVRLGGYLNPELFASYRIGTADPADPGFGFTNEVALRYGLGPLNLDILGRLDFPAAGTLNESRPELGVGVSYDFGRALSIDTGVTLSTQRSVVSFGVALRW